MRIDGMNNRPDWTKKKIFTHRVPVPVFNSTENNSVKQYGKRYFFEEVKHCEMCGDPTDKHKVLGQRLNQSQGPSPKRKEGIAVSVKKCTNCNLIYSSPQPVPFDIQDHYGMPPDTFWPSSYFNFDEAYFAKEIETASSLLNFTPGMTALDVGAGLGKAMLALEKKGFETYGLEPSKPFYEKAIDKMSINPDRLKHGAVEEVDYPDAFFDFITYGAVLEHLYHPAQSIEKTLKWLKPGGVIHLEVPSSEWFLAKLINFYYRLRGTNYVTNISPMHAPFHLYEFDVKSFQQLGEKLGFSIEHYEHQVCYIYFFPKFLHGILRKYMKFTNSGMQLIMYLKRK